MTTENPILETAEVFYNQPSTDEPKEPTEEDVTKQVIEPEQDVELEKPEELDDKPKESEEEESDDEKEHQYLELDGDDVDLEDVRKWRDGHLMQSDYTKKTTALADERKTFNAERESEREQLLKSKTELDEMRDMLSVLVSEDEVINWAELKADDPDRYIELKELADKRKEAKEQLAQARKTPVDDPATIQAEQEKLFKNNPEWFDDKNEPTDVYQADIKLMNNYAVKAGFSVDEFSQMTRAHYLTTILKAAKFDAIQDKGREIKNKRDKVPVVTKPKANKQVVSRSAADVFYGGD